MKLKDRRQSKNIEDLRQPSGVAVNNVSEAKMTKARKKAVDRTRISEGTADQLMRRWASGKAKKVPTTSSSLGRRVIKQAFKKTLSK